MLMLLSSLITVHLQQPQRSSYTMNLWMDCVVVILALVLGLSSNNGHNIKLCRMGYPSYTSGDSQGPLYRTAIRSRSEVSVLIFSVRYIRDRGRSDVTIWLLIFVTAIELFSRELGDFISAAGEIPPGRGDAVRFVSVDATLEQFITAVRFVTADDAVRFFTSVAGACPPDRGDDVVEVVVGSLLVFSNVWRCRGVGKISGDNTDAIAEGTFPETTTGTMATLTAIKISSLNTLVLLFDGPIADYSPIADSITGFLEVLIRPATIAEETDDLLGLIRVTPEKLVIQWGVLSMGTPPEAMKSENSGGSGQLTGILLQLFRGDREIIGLHKLFKDAGIVVFFYEVVKYALRYRSLRGLNPAMVQRVKQNSQGTSVRDRWLKCK